VKGPKPRSERFTVRLTAELREAIDRAAERSRRSPSDWVVLALEAAVQTEAGKAGDLRSLLGLAEPGAAAKKKKRGT